MGILKGSGVADSIDALRRSAAGGSSGRSAQLFLKNDSSIKIRFLQEPTSFYEYLEHYDPERKMFVPAIENDPLDQHPNDQVRKVGKRWIVNVLNVEDGRVRIVKLNQDQINRLLVRHQKYGTLLDRNYELMRIGGGRDSKFDVDADDPTQIDLARFQDKMHDLEDWLLGEIDEYHSTNFQAEYRRMREASNGAATAPADAMEAIKPAIDPEAAKAQAAAAKIAGLDEKYGAEPPWSEKDGEDTKLPPPEPTASTTGGTTPPTPAPAEPAPGMAEIAAQTEAAKLAAVPDPAPVAVEEDPWVAAKENGQPCVKGEDDKCVICGFNVTECLMGK